MLLYTIIIYFHRFLDVHVLENSILKHPLGVITREEKSACHRGRVGDLQGHCRCWRRVVDIGKGTGAETLCVKQ